MFRCVLGRVFVVSVLACLFGCQSQLDLSSYKDVAGACKKAKLPDIKNAGFEGGMSYWNSNNPRLNEFSTQQAMGYSGTAGFRIRRENPEHYSIANQQIQFVPGEAYNLGAWVKVGKLENAPNKVGCVGIEFWNDGNYLGGSHGHLDTTKSDWQYITLPKPAVMPAKAKTGNIVLFLRRGTTGDIFLDDLTLLHGDSTPTVCWLVFPSKNTITTGNGKITIRVVNESAKVMKTLETGTCVLDVDTSGTKKQVVAKLKSGYIEANLGQLPAGNGTINLAIVNSDNKTILYKTTLTLNVANADRQLPVGACMIDEYGRPIVDGKPFMPLGVYLYVKKKQYDQYNTTLKQELEHLAKSPFNTILDYKNEVFNELDFLQKNKMKVIGDVIAYPELKPNNRIYFAKQKKKKLELVEKYKSHPAVLAWYIADEIKYKNRKSVEARRQLLNRLDPFHPTYAVYCNGKDAVLLGNNQDIIGMDPYPLFYGDPKNMSTIVNALSATKKTGLPRWSVPQLFGYGEHLYRFSKEYKKNADKQGTNYKASRRRPNQKEMRSYYILMAILGTRGFIGYKYDNIFAVPEILRKEYSEKCRKEMFAAAQVIKDQENFIMSKAGPLPIELEIVKGQVKAAKFTDDNGNVRVMLAAIGPGEAEGIITIKSDKPLTSRFGNTTYLGSNQYKFSATNVDSDILQ